MNKWEYKTVQISLYDGISHVLNIEGSEGWEAVAMTTLPIDGLHVTHQFLMKRQQQAQAVVADVGPGRKVTITHKGK